MTNSAIPPSPTTEQHLAADRDADAPFAADDPMALFTAWLTEAGKLEPSDPHAMSVATVSADGQPNVRILLLRTYDERGFCFYTNTTSVKGDEIAAVGKAALCFHWKSLARQVRVRGTVAPVPDAEADAYFKTRARGSQIGAWASDQSQPLDARETLQARVAEIEAKYGRADVPRPPHWSGYRVTPVEMEFWADGAFRLHNRRLFARDGAGWRSQRLYP